MELKIIKTDSLKQKPLRPLVFGRNFTDHMFVMEYEGGQWKNARIQPYAPFTLDPSAAIFHYAQSVFEGLKAFKNDKGEIRVFRPRENFKRLNESSARLCIPKADEEFLLKALKELILLDEDWIPTNEGESLYIRPAIIATEPVLGVHASLKYTLFIILSPVGAYYANGLKPVKLYVEEDYVRACLGGTGHHKVGGNYAASLIAGEKAKKEYGCDQVMWLDAQNRKYVEEVGSMNIFFVFGNKVITPELGGSILPGITRKSAIELLKSDGYEVAERKIAIDEIVDGAGNGSLTEIFGTGTAAVISPVGAFIYGKKEHVVSGGAMGPVSGTLYNKFTSIQTGKLPDKFGWVEKIK